jgi:hypothetical protein
MMHLVLEGPDGGGKTRLAEAICDQFPTMKSAEKASTSKTGPIRNLAAWTRAQFDVMDKSICPLLYDRHPVISEPIYGPLVRGGAQPGFQPSPWLSTARLQMYSRTFVIWCIPPLEEVQKAVIDGRDMPGVAENIEKIHAEYLRIMPLWSGRGMRYNFADGESSVLPSGRFSSAVRWVEDHFAVLLEELSRYNG